MGAQVDFGLSVTDPSKPLSAPQRNARSLRDAHAPDGQPHNRYITVTKTLHLMDVLDAWVPPEAAPRRIL